MCEIAVAAVLEETALHSVVVEGAPYDVMLAAGACGGVY